VSQTDTSRYPLAHGQTTLGAAQGRLRLCCITPITRPPFSFALCLLPSAFLLSRGDGLLRTNPLSVTAGWTLL
jgi:hypothetical protein